MTDKWYSDEFRDKKENKSHGNSDFPVAVYSAYFRANPAFEEGADYYFFNAHWHEEFELFYLRTGECKFCIDGICYELRAGEAIFVPSNAIHWCFRSDNKQDSEYEILVFHPSILTGRGIDAVDSNIFCNVVITAFCQGTVSENTVAN